MSNIHIYKNDEIVRVLCLLQRAGFSSALIAGGAVRDLYFDLMPRDIDIFIWDPAVSTESGTIDVRHPMNGNRALWDILQLHGGDNQYDVVMDSVEWAFNNEYSSPQQVAGVWNVMKNFIPYQIILTLQPPIEFVNNRFDIGLCKAYCDGVKFRYTPDFMRDVQHKQFTIVGRDMTQSEFDYTQYVHIPRIASKFPGYRVKVAPWNQHMVDKSVTFI